MRHSTAESLARARAQFQATSEKLAAQTLAFRQQTQTYATENRARADWATVGTLQHLTATMAQAIKDIQSAMDSNARKGQKVSAERFCTCGKTADAWCETNEAWECGACHINATCDQT